MKSTYKRKIATKDKWWLGVAFLVVAIYIIFTWLGNKDATHAIVQTVYWLLYWGIFLYVHIKVPVAKINYETNKLVISGGHCVNIPHIFSLEESGKKGLRVRYLFNDMERSSLIPPVIDNDKPRLLADLLQINPGIVING